MRSPRIARRIGATVAHGPVEWVVFSIFMLGFGALLLFVGVVESIDEARDAAQGVSGTALVRSCNDLRVQTCAVRIISPPNERRDAAVEFTRSVEPGDRVQISILPSGEIVLVGPVERLWRVGSISGGLFLAGVGGWRLVTGRSDD